MGRQDTLSAARLIDNAVKISFAQANLGSQMRRLRARCKRNRPLPRRDGANLLPLGMKADLSTSSDRLPSSLSPSTPRTPSRTPSFSSFPPFNLSVHAYRTGKVKVGINTRYKGVLALSSSIPLPFFRSGPSRYPLPLLAAIWIVSSPVSSVVSTNVPSIDLSNPSQAPDSSPIRAPSNSITRAERKKRRRGREKGRRENETRRSKRVEREEMNFQSVVNHG